MRNKIKIIFIPLLLFSITAPIVIAAEGAKWPGVDETVVEKIAEEQGRPAWTPFINTDQGDLLLFLFLLAGIAGGFIMGYNFQKLFAKKGPKQ